MTKQKIPWLRVAIEGMVIVGSILLAFGIDAWWEDRRDRLDERVVLRELVQSLEVDLDELGSRYAIQIETGHNVQTLLDHFEADASYSPELEPLFGALSTWVGVLTNDAAYEALKSRGLGLISSDSLRLGLIYYYENQFPRLLSASLHDEAFVKESITPYFLANFLIADIGWAPRNYEAVRSDPYLRNVCAMKLGRLEGRILPYYEKSLEMVRNLLRDIEAELVE